MALFDRETDPAKERDGVALDFGEYRVTLRRQGGANETYQRELDAALRPHRAVISAGAFPPAKMDEIVFRVFARSCVARWETKASTMPTVQVIPGADGFVDGIDLRGKLVPATEENLVTVFTALPGVFLDLREAARNEQLFRHQQRENDRGN